MNRQLRPSTNLFYSILALSICLVFYWQNSAYSAENEPADKLAWQKWHEPSSWKAKYVGHEKNGIQVHIGDAVAEQGELGSKIPITGKIILTGVSYDVIPRSYNLFISIEKTIYGPMGTFTTSIRTIVVNIADKMSGYSRTTVFVGNVISDFSSETLTTLGTELCFFDYSPQLQTISVSLINVPIPTE